MSAKRKLTIVDGNGPPPGSPGAEDWHRQLTRNKEGSVEGTLFNAVLILENDEHLKALFWLNESSNQVVLARQGPWPGGNIHEFTDTDSYELARWLQDPETYGMRIGDDLALKAVTAVARRHRRHPIREYLRALKWDGVPRVGSMFIDLFGAIDKTYHRQAAPCFMVGAVARVLHVDAKQPFVGAQVDFMLVLESKQGKYKTSSLRALFGSEWYVETNEPPASKDFYQVIQGCWCVEIAEMDSFSKADVTAVKTSITRRTDKYRAPYDRIPRSHRRECVFAGTTNESEYLRDATGGRRFLPVRLQEGGIIDVAAVQAVRDQLWAEAVHLFDQGHQWWVLPDDVEEEQEERYFADSWEDMVRIWLSGKAPKRGSGLEPYPERLAAGWPVEWATTSEILIYALSVDPARHGRAEQMRVASSMKRLGWTHKRDWFDGRDMPRTRRWVRASGESAAGKGVDDDVPF